MTSRSFLGPTLRHPNLGPFSPGFRARGSLGDRIFPESAAIAHSFALTEAPTNRLPLFGVEDLVAGVLTAAGRKFLQLGAFPVTEITAEGLAIELVPTHFYFSVLEHFLRGAN